MDVFAKNLRELMEENSIDVKTLAQGLNTSNSIVYRWLNDALGLLLPSAIKIADFFDCSLDYLFGRSANYEKGSYRKCPPFDERLRKVFEEHKVSQYRVIKDKVLSGGHVDSWLNNKKTPHIESVIKLANYLDVSMDYLVGREK